MHQLIFLRTLRGITRRYAAGSIAILKEVGAGLRRGSAEVRRGGGSDCAALFRRAERNCARRIGVGLLTVEGPCEPTGCTLKSPFVMLAGSKASRASFSSTAQEEKRCGLSRWPLPSVWCSPARRWPPAPLRNDRPGAKCERALAPSRAIIEDAWALHHAAAHFARRRGAISAPAVLHERVKEVDGAPSSPAPRRIGKSREAHSDYILVVSRRRYVGMTATTSIYPVGSSQNVCRSPTFGFAGKIQESGRRADASCRRPAHDKCHEF
jgi:hypothetical protein